MRRTPALTIALLAAAVALPASPAAAKGLVGMSVCGAKGCVDRSDMIGKGRDAEALLNTGASVADPGRGAFVRLKMHIGDPQTGEQFGTPTTLIYLTNKGLIRTGEGTWFMPDPEAATLYKRAAHGVARFPATALTPFRPPPATQGQVVETYTPARKPAPATAAAHDGGGGLTAGLIGGAAAAIALAAAAAFAMNRRGRPATG
jgi:hypothetical protein